MGIFKVISITDGWLRTEMRCNIRLFDVTRYAGILSAYGMALADVVHEAQEPCAVVYSQGIDSGSAK